MREESTKTIAKKIDFSSCNNFQKWYYKNIEIAVVYESTYKC